MGNFLIVLGFIVIISAPFSVYASELLGRISTDPTANTGTVISVPEAPSPVATAAANGGAAVPVISSRAADTLIDKEPAPTEKTAKILGQKIYLDGSLVRDAEGRIFLIQGQAKKPVRNMLELEKYRGQTILLGTADDLSQYRTREHLDGDLIRQKNDVKVYALKKGMKYHILNLVELAKHYFGLPIYNIEPDEMKKYD
jgi:hypothetical protein